MFQNREEAGFLLAKKLKEFQKRSDVIVLAIPRGGVVVGRQIAFNLKIPLEILVVKKIGAPYNPELAIGAIAPGGIKYIELDLVKHLGVDNNYLRSEIKRKQKEIEERKRKFQIQKSKVKSQNYQTVILTDDGVATGATVLAAIKYIKQNLVEIILAVPVIAQDTYHRIESEVERIVALEIPESFAAVGQFYREFLQVSDEEVIRNIQVISQ